MTLSLDSLLTPVTEEEALDTSLAILTSLGFNVTSWQDGSVQRTLIQHVARLYSSLTETVAEIAAGGFNGLATGGYLTLLSKSHYENTRVAAVNTQGDIVLTSTATAPPHVIAVGDLQIADTATASPTTQTFRNITGGTLNPGSTLTLSFEAEVAGEAGNIPNNTTLYMWTPLVGVTATNPPNGLTGTWITQVGIDEEADERLTDRNASKWATLSYAATDGAYRNWALAADSSVTRVKVRSDNPFGAGSVDVVCATAVGSITPTQETDILAYIEGTSDGVGRRPINDIVSVNGAVVVYIPIIGTITVDATYQTITTEAVIHAAIDAYMNTLDIGGTPVPPASNGFAIYGEIIAAIMALDGVISTTITTPSGNVALLETQILSVNDYTGLVVSYV